MHERWTSYPFEADSLDLAWDLGGSREVSTRLACLKRLQLLLNDVATTRRTNKVSECSQTSSRQGLILHSLALVLARILASCRLCYSSSTHSLFAAAALTTTAAAAAAITALTATTVATATAAAMLNTVPRSMWDSMRVLRFAEKEKRISSWEPRTSRLERWRNPYTSPLLGQRRELVSP